MTISRLAPLAGLALASSMSAYGVWLLASGDHEPEARRRPISATSQAENLPSTSLPRPSVIAIDPRPFEDGGLKTAILHAERPRDPDSLSELRDSVAARGKRGIAALSERFESLKSGGPVSPSLSSDRMETAKSLGLLHMYEGDMVAAARWIEIALAESRASGIPPQARGELMAVRGIIALRRGELENCVACVGPSSCIYPIQTSAVHAYPDGSREAARWFGDYLRESPGDLRVIWLLNIAAMTLGEYPDKVPPQFRIPQTLFRSTCQIGRLENVALATGLTTRGPGLAGGSIFDDFTGDGLPDLLVTSLDTTRGASLFVNNGDGTFADRSDVAGLHDQVYALNVARADYDNDGDLDVLLLRGGWETPLRPSLMRNRGNGRFEDVTRAAGLLNPIQSEAAAWADYDNDGRLDVFVCGEYLDPGATGPTPHADARNRCRLYHNNGDGTFTDRAVKAGVLNERCAKGAAWGDFDGDGLIDLFVSNMGQPSRLYRNLGDGSFRDVAHEVGIDGAPMSFACWFWDYDNDGRLDLYANDYQAGLAEVLASAAGADDGGRHRPRLYRNEDPQGFRDVAAEIGLGRAMVPMGSNFGDLDNDGYLDLYLGTGGMSFGYLVPNQLFRNAAGRRFEDVTESSGTGHLQKGHGVSFADYDSDGDLDLFCESGGAVPGDASYNLLFRNPGHRRRWLKVKLVGRTSNRSAIGATIKADLEGRAGETWSIHRTIGNNSSFGGNSLVEHLGLNEAVRVSALTIHWPTSGTKQTFTNLPLDRQVEITEGQTAPQVSPAVPTLGR